MRTLYYKFLVLFFYHIGDVACRLPWEWAANLYQKAMNLSLDCDDKIDYWFWKEPPLERDVEDL